MAAQADAALHVAFHRPVHLLVAHARVAQGGTGTQRARRAVREARRSGWLDKGASIWLVGDHPNDSLAAKANRVRSVAVATGLVCAEELARHAPDILVEDLRSLSIRQLIGD